MLNKDKQNLVVNYMYFADKIALNHFKKTPPQVQLDELKSAAYAGLVDAASKYDGTRDFKAYAAWRIIGEIKDYLRSLKWSKFSVCPLGDMDIPSKEIEPDVSVCLDGISRTGKQVLEMYFLQEMTLSEIAEKVSLTPARISQIIKENLSILRNCQAA